MMHNGFHLILGGTSGDGSGTFGARRTVPSVEKDNKPTSMCQGNASSKIKLRDETRSMHAPSRFSLVDKLLCESAVSPLIGGEKGGSP